MTLIQRCLNIDATLYKRHVPAGKRCNHEDLHISTDTMINEVIILNNIFAPELICPYSV